MPGRPVIAIGSSARSCRRHERNAERRRGFRPHVRVDRLDGEGLPVGYVSLGDRRGARAVAGVDRPHTERRWLAMDNPRSVRRPSRLRVPAPVELLPQDGLTGAVGPDRLDASRDGVELDAAVGSRAPVEDKSVARGGPVGIAVRRAQPAVRGIGNRHPRDIGPVRIHHIDRVLAVRVARGIGVDASGKRDLRSVGQTRARSRSPGRS